MSTKNPEEKKKTTEKKQTKMATKTKKGSRATTSKKNKKKDEEEARIERMPVKTRRKKTKKTEIDKEKEITTTDQKEKKATATKKTTTKAIPKEWKQPTKEKKRTTEKKERKSLISTLKRSISTKKPPKEKEIMAPMNIVVTLNPIKHADIIEYIDEHISSGGRAEWVRDSIRLKMRVEEGVYGLDAGGQSGAQRDTETMMQSVFGRFAEVMTQVMREIRTEQPATGAPARPRPAPRVERTGEPPQLKKIEGGRIGEAVKPDRPALDDAIGAIVVVE